MYFARAVGYCTVCATKYLIYNYNMVRGQERNERAPRNFKGQTMTMGKGTGDGNEGAGSMIGDVHCVKSSDVVDR
jgi:hypothetical protein